MGARPSLASAFRLLFMVGMEEVGFPPGLGGGVRVRGDRVRVDRVRGKGRGIM